MDVEIWKGRTKGLYKRSEIPNAMHRFGWGLVVIVFVHHFIQYGQVAFVKDLFDE
jgi:hypothetical protein